MASKHLKHDRGSSRRKIALVGAVAAVALVALAATTAIHAMTIHATAIHATDGNPTAAREVTSIPAGPQPLSQEGRLVAVTPTSVTAVSVDGFARTYLIDGQTNAITADGSLVGGAGVTFAVNDEVAIVGVVRDGTAVATAVADRRVSNLDGPPMDAV